MNIINLGDIGCDKMSSLADFNVNERPQWCPGCGDFAIVTAVRKALVDLGLAPEEVVVVSGIGCGSKIPHYIRSYGYEGIHGRLLPLAYGVKLANEKLTVVGIGGDGDGIAEGGNHFHHAFRYNANITYLLQDNQIYGLTTGQASPTSHKGMKTKTTLEGVEIPEARLVPIAISAGATFVATTFAGNMKHMVEMFKEAILHKGFSFVDVYQPCVTWNKINSYEYWSKHGYLTDHDPTDFDKAMEKALEPYKTNWEKVPLGVIYKEERPTLEEIIGAEEEMKTDISKDLEKLR